MEYREIPYLCDDTVVDVYMRNFVRSGGALRSFAVAFVIENARLKKSIVVTY